MAKKPKKTVRGTGILRHAERKKLVPAWANALANDAEVNALREKCCEIVEKASFTERELLFLGKLTSLFDDKGKWITPRRAAELSGYKSSAMGTLLMKRPHIEATLALFWLEVMELKLTTLSEGGDPKHSIIPVKIAKRDRDGD